MTLWLYDLKALKSLFERYNNDEKVLDMIGLRKIGEI